MDWHSGRVSNSGSMGCEFFPRWHHCFNSLTALGKLLTTNVHPEMNKYLAKDSVYLVAPGIVVVGAMGVFLCAPQGVEMVY